MKILGSYTNGNFRTAIFEDGTKIRETNDDGTPKSWKTINI